MGDTWLRQKRFECPVCRADVTRKPVRTRAVDALVMKAVSRLCDEKKEEYAERVAAAEAFFNIGSSWSRKERETFQIGIKDYAGDTRQTYCKLTGLTVQWVHSATDTQLNQALHNLQLASFVSNPEDKIRQRLLMFLRYG